MGFYDAFKDVLNLARKADDVELYRQLLELSEQALDLQAQNTKLKEENDALKKEKINEELIVRHKQPYLTMKNDSQELKFCATCWDSERKLIQLRTIEDWTSGNKLICNKCGSKCRQDS